MSTGYSVKLVKRVYTADAKKIGVRLGRHCIDKDIPVRTVAERLEVTRQLVYLWFTGKVEPQKGNYEAIQKYLAEIAGDESTNVLQFDIT